MAEVWCSSKWPTRTEPCQHHYIGGCIYAVCTFQRGKQSIKTKVDGNILISYNLFMNGVILMHEDWLLIDVFKCLITFQQQMQSEDDQNALARLKGAQKLVSCRYCKGDHWSKQCPYKVSILITMIPCLTLTSKTTLCVFSGLIMLWSSMKTG